MTVETWVVGGAIRRAGEVLAAQRGPEMSLAGQWEFPGGKIEDDETPEQALVRELEEELGVVVQVGGLVGRSVYETADRRLVLDVYWCEVRSGTLAPVEHSELRWVPIAQLADLDWAIADIPIVSLICDAGP